MPRNGSDSACTRCGDECTSRYDLHGWLCDECADTIHENGDPVYSQAEIEMTGGYE